MPLFHVPPLHLWKILSFQQLQLFICCSKCHNRCNTQCQSASTRGVGCWLTDSTASSSCKLCNIPSKLRIIISRLYSNSEVVAYTLVPLSRTVIRTGYKAICHIDFPSICFYIMYVFFLPVAIDVRRRQCCVMDYITLCQSTRTSFPVFLYQL